MNPDDATFARQIGRLEGNVEALSERIGTVSENLRDLRSENAHDHGEVIRRLEQIHGRLDQKADVARVNNHAARIDSLEATRDKGDGATLVVRGIYAFAVLGIAALAYLSGNGAL